MASAPKRHQVPRACDRCKTLRRGCSEYRPCRRCIDSGYADSCTLHTPSIAGSRTLEEAMMKRLSELASGPFVDSCLDKYFGSLYPTIPILTRDYVQRLKTRCFGVQSPCIQSYCVLIAVCAQVILQVESPEGLEGIDSGSNQNQVRGEFLLQEVRAIHGGLNRRQRPGLERCLIAFFLYACEASVCHHSQAFILLREATTLFTVLRIDEDDSLAASVSTRLFWVLLVSERSHAVRYRRSITLQITPDSFNIDLEDSSLAGLWNLVALFRPINTLFMALLNQEMVGAPDKTIIDEAEVQINGALSSDLTLQNAQKANLRVTQLWLRTIIWQLRLRLGFLSKQAPQRSLTYEYPVDIARETTLSTRDLPITSILIHGVGMTEKLFDIASAVTDVMAGTGITTALRPGIDRMTPEDDIKYLRQLIVHLPGGRDLYDGLLEKQAQQSSPAAWQGHIMSPG